MRESRRLWTREIQEAMELLKQQFGLFNDEDNVLKCKGRLENASSVTLSCCQLKATSDDKVDCRSLAQSQTWNAEKLIQDPFLKTLCEIYPSSVRHVKKIRGITSQTTACCWPPRNKSYPGLTRVGVDFTGPLFVKGTRSTAKQRKKVYSTYVPLTS